MLGVFFGSLLIGYSGALMPGSLLTYAIDKSIKFGKKSGFIISIGHSLLELFIVLILMLGFGKYLAADPSRIIIGFIGGIILCFLGADAIRGIVANKLSVNFEGGSSSRHGNLFVGGAVISASNPYFLIWWVGVGLGLNPEVTKCLWNVRRAAVLFRAYIKRYFVVWFCFGFSG